MESFKAWKDQPPVPWEPQTYYKVDVKLYASNSKHTAIFFTGFLKNRLPDNYSCFWSATYAEDRRKYRDATIFKVEKLFTKE